MARTSRGRVTRVMLTTHLAGTAGPLPHPHIPCEDGPCAVEVQWPMPLASLSSTLTQFIGDYGLYAVFVLMLIDAVFPAASELVMVYGGAIASGAIAGQSVTLFGTRSRRGCPPTSRSRSPARSAT